VFITIIAENFDFHGVNLCALAVQTARIFARATYDGCEEGGCFAGRVISKCEANG